MIQKDLIKQLTAYRGPVLVEVQNFNDIFWIQAVKSDLIVQLNGLFEPNEETGFGFDNFDKNGYFGKDFASND